MDVFFFFKQKTAYEMRISDWSSDVCSSDLGYTQPDFVLRRRAGGHTQCRDGGHAHSQLANRKFHHICLPMDTFKKTTPALQKHYDRRRCKKATIIMTAPCTAAFR